MLQLFANVQNLPSLMILLPILLYQYDEVIIELFY
jgi:hypothetical protein